jgi:hypothetical protein
MEENDQGYKEFFERHGDGNICTKEWGGGTRIIRTHISIEELYQAFKARFADEQMVSKRPITDDGNTTHGYFPSWKFTK